MSDFDSFAQLLLEEAKRFLEKAEEEKEGEAQTAYQHAALNIGFCALEAHVNAMAEDFLTRPDLQVLEVSILSERDFKLENGRFVVGNSLKMYRLEDRIQFLVSRFSTSPLKKDEPWWGQLKGAMDLRNKLSHPKEAAEVTLKKVKDALQAIVGALDYMYESLYQRGFPPARRGLQSVLTF
jgi:hypothetical protein